MLRFAFCLLIAFASASASARDVKMSSPNGSCPTEQQARIGERKRAAAPQQETRLRPSEHSDVPSSGGGGRTQSPRWHSFLPGMVR